MPNFMSHILICHDMQDLAETKAGVWQELEGIPAEACATVAQAVGRIEMGLDDIDVIVIHKDFGQYSGEREGAQAVLKALGSREKYERIRRGYISGEFPDGVNHTKEDGMDFYFPTSLDSRDAWLLTQLRSGYVTDSELASRGKKLEMPVGYTGHPERGSLSDLMRW